MLEKHPVKRIGVKGGVQEILNHKWFNNINVASVLEGKIKPPLKPDILAFNFDEVLNLSHYKNIGRISKR